LVCGHEVFCCGARVRIHGDKVEVLSEPKVLRCPLHESLYGFEAIDKDVVKKTVEAKMKNYGFCCSQRIFDDSLLVPYGASEIIKVCMEKDLIQGAVIVCDGAGTVITSNPSLVQGIGARLTGIIKTSPIPEIIRHIEAHNGMVLDPKDARIDQVEGLKRAIEMGLRDIAITVAGFRAEEISRIRKIEEETKGVRATVFSVCNTCITEGDLDYIEAADIVWASASKILRESIGAKALMQVGVGIPVFILTKRGKEIMLSYLMDFKDKIVIFRSQLPYLVDGRSPVLKKRE
jgi:putative methanogenesis marker protein 8